MGPYSAYGYKYHDLDPVEALRQADRDNLLWEQTQKIKSLQKENKNIKVPTHTSSIPQYSCDLTDETYYLNDDEYDKYLDIEKEINQLETNKRLCEDGAEDNFIFPHIFISLMLGIIVGACSSISIGLITGFGCLAILLLIHYGVIHMLKNKCNYIDEVIADKKKQLRKYKNLSLKRAKREAKKR